MPGTIPDGRRRQKNLLVVGLALSSVILVLMAGLVFFNARRISGASFWVSHTWEVKAALHGLSAATDEALTAHRNFLVTKQPRYLERQTAARATVDGGLKRVAALTRDNAVQQQNLQLLTKAVQARRVVDDEMTERAGAGDAPADLESAIGREEKLGDNLRAIVAVMEREEDRLMAFRRDRERRQTTRSFVILGVLLLLNFAAVGVVAWLWRRVQRLQRLVTICAWSRLLRHGDEWLSIEDFLEREYGVSVTHGMSEAELAKFSEQLGERDADGAARKN